MPRGQMTERYVQDTALRWLLDYYGERENPRSIISEQEVVVRAEMGFGNGRADGLVAWIRPDSSVEVAVVEAKSTRKLQDLIRHYLDRRWVLHGAGVALAGFLVSGAVGRVTGHWLTVWIVPVVIAVVAGILFLLRTFDDPRYQSVSVVEQVKRYPANERWIATSADALNRLGDELEYELIERCRWEGIGLLRVSPGRRATAVVLPSTNSTPPSLEDFLRCYSREQRMRSRLGTASLADSEIDT